MNSYLVIFLYPWNKIWTRMWTGCLSFSISWETKFSELLPLINMKHGFSSDLHPVRKMFCLAQCWSFSCFGAKRSWNFEINFFLGQAHRHYILAIHPQVQAFHHILGCHSSFIPCLVTSYFSSPSSTSGFSSYNGLSFIFQTHVQFHFMSIFRCYWRVDCLFLRLFNVYFCEKQG